MIFATMISEEGDIAGVSWRLTTKPDDDDDNDDDDGDGDGDGGGWYSGRILEADYKTWISVTIGRSHGLRPFGRAFPMISTTITITINITNFITIISNTMMKSAISKHLPS